MFRIELFCEGRKLEEVYRSLAGKVVQISAPQPVANAVAGRDGKLEQATGGTLAELFVTHLQERGISAVKKSDLLAWLPTMSKSPGSAGYVLKQLVQAGVLQSNGLRGKSCSYNVQLSTPKPAAKAKSKKGK